MFALSVCVVKMISLTWFDQSSWIGHPFEYDGKVCVYMHSQLRVLRSLGFDLSYLLWM